MIDGLKAAASMPGMIDMARQVATYLHAIQAGLSQLVGLEAPAGQYLLSRANYLNGVDAGAIDFRNPCRWCEVLCLNTSAGDATLQFYDRNGSPLGPFMTVPIGALRPIDVRAYQFKPIGSGGTGTVEVVWYL